MGRPTAQDSKQILTLIILKISVEFRLNELMIPFVSVKSVVSVCGVRVHR